MLKLGRRRNRRREETVEADAGVIFSKLQQTEGEEEEISGKMS